MIDNFKEDIIFAGSTISSEEIKSIFPDCLVLPPAKCGDILFALRLKPKRILLIDGVFEAIPAVWHKEILYAINQGVFVAGAASMGALRAVELSKYGMFGIGEIFKKYYSNEIIDDDEVAVLHGDAEIGYKPLTDAMVNIRFSIEKAIAKKIINHEAAAEILSSAKNTFYKQRVFSQLVDTNTSLSELQKFFLKDNYFDQKRVDVIEAVNYIKDSKPLGQKSNYIVDTVYFRTLHKQVMTSVFPNSFNCYKNDEVVKFINNDPRKYKSYVRLAHLMSIALPLAKKNLNINTLNKLVNKLAQIKTLSINCDSLKTLFDYATDDSLHKITVLLWNYIIDCCNKCDVQPSEFLINRVKKAFIQKHKDLTLDAEIFRQAALIDFIVMQNNTEVLGIKYKLDDTSWLYEVVSFVRSL